MALKRSSPLDDPPTASSSEEEETSSGEEEEEDASTEEEGEEDKNAKVENQKPKKTSTLPSITPATEKKPPSSSSESGSGSDSDTDTESGKNVKPIASKPMEETAKSKKPSSKPMEETPISKKPRSKPSASATPARSSKRAKKKGSEGDLNDGAVVEGDSKKSGEESKKLFQRLWSEDDEIAILKGMIDYSAKKGSDPSADMNAFHEFIKKSLQVDVTKSQLMDKIRRLKKKYNNNTGRGKNGQDPTFSKRHDLKAFELSKKIWGSEGTSGTLENSKSNGTARKKQKVSTNRSLESELLLSPNGPKEDDNQMEIDGNLGSSDCFNELAGFDKEMGLVGLPQKVVKIGLELVERSKREEMEGEWEKLHLAELELFVKRTELIRDQANMILDAYKSSGK